MPWQRSTSPIEDPDAVPVSLQMWMPALRLLIVFHVRPHPSRTTQGPLLELSASGLSAEVCQMISSESTDFDRNQKKYITCTYIHIILMHGQRLGLESIVMGWYWIKPKSILIDLITQVFSKKTCH